MRSLAATLILACLAVLLCGAAGWHLRQGNLDALFGVPPTAVGQRLYDSFLPEDVRHIRISGAAGTAEFAYGPKGWQCLSPWADRMDPRAAASIIQFTLGMRVEDRAEADNTDKQKSGLGRQAVKIRLENAQRLPLAIFRLGRAAPWKAELDGYEQAVATVFVRPQDKHRKRHVYVCTGDISPLFKDGLRYLRDHRPFFFNPLQLAKIRIRSQQGDLTLGRESPQQPWRIVKPLELPTDPAAVKSLLEGLFELCAVRLQDRPVSTSQTVTESAVKSAQIAITSFGSDLETVLEIHPPESPVALESEATVSDRPGTLFALPLKPEPGLISLAELPLTLNELRDPTLTRLNIAALRGISIKPSTGPEILIKREPPAPWQVTVQGQTRAANEELLFALLKAVTTSRATGFVSDAATDFTPWGLDRPVLTMRFVAEDRQALEIRFGIDRHGEVFANRSGTPIVMRMDPALLGAISVRPHEWRHARVWSINRVNLLAIERQQAETAPLLMKYDFLTESWQAERAGEDLTAKLDINRANFLLGVLENLQAARWLAPGDPEAIAALAKPSLHLAVTEKSIDAEGELSGLSRHELWLAPAQDAAGHYFARLGGDAQPFLLDPATVTKLSADLLEK